MTIRHLLVALSATSVFALATLFALGLAAPAAAREAARGPDQHQQRDDARDAKKKARKA